MPTHCILLFSGPLAVGKTAVRQELVSHHRFAYLRSSDYLRRVAKAQGLNPDRLVLQNLGDSLDVSRDYRWLIDDVAGAAFDGSPEQRRWIVDAVRKQRQIDHFRARFKSAIYHIHFTAPENVLRERYQARQQGQGTAADMTPFEAAIDHENERAARSLINSADMVVDLVDESVPSVAIQILERVNNRHT